MVLTEEEKKRIEEKRAKTLAKIKNWQMQQKMMEKLEKNVQLSKYLPFDVVPVNTFFKFKIISESGVDSHKISYNLKQGSFLPYATHIGGKIPSFDL